MQAEKKEDILSKIELLSKWLVGNSWKGYDPYDIKGTNLMIWVARKSATSKFFLVIRELLYEGFLFFPRLSRLLFGVHKTINAKAMGLLALSYLSLYRNSQNRDYLVRSEECLSWLKSNCITSEDGIGWGYPFDWQSSEYIPANTPNGIVTTAVGTAFWEYYKYSGNLEDLEYCEQIAGFLASLPVDQIDEERICFSYTPLFTNHVHNLNLFVAEFLLKVGKEKNNKKYITLAQKAVKYTISDQHSNGAFDYNGPPEIPDNFIDNYHTGFVLRMLHSIWKITEDERVFKALKRGYDYYLDNFFIEDRIPKFTPERLYRIDIHSCAESILCTATLSRTLKKGEERPIRVFEWAVKNLWNKKGYFYHGIFKSRLFGLRFKSKIPYIRWGQAWMLHAIVTLITKTDA